MIKRALPVAIGVMSFCLGALAQGGLTSGLEADETLSPEQLRITGEVDTPAALSAFRPDVFSTVDGSILIHELPVLTLLDGRRFPISNELGRMGMAPVDLFPIAFLSAVEPQRVAASPLDGSDAPGGVVNLLRSRVYTGGEAGVFYGKSGGKYGREDFEAHIIGSVGTDKFRITAGVSHEESSGRYRSYSRY